MHLYRPHNMMHNETDNIRIAITSDSANHRHFLQKSMEHSGIEVVLNESLTERFMHKLDSSESDVVLFDMEAIEDEHLEYLDQLLEQSQVPIIINDVSALTLNEPKASSKWNNTLLQKIVDITGRNSEAAQQPQQVKPLTLKYSQQDLARNVWVLGASLGGPDALKRFLAEIPADLPVAFIIAQHLGENFVSLLAEQLDRYTEFSVIVPKAGHVVRHQQVLVTPTDQRMLINPIGAVEYRHLTASMPYSPSIDTVIEDVAGRYKNRAGAIIFSGMCDDGVRGCEALAQKGGQVWIQDPQSCVISAMPESVASKVDVSQRATPEQLAQELVALYSKAH